jgi:hypothetical protein
MISNRTQCWLTSLIRVVMTLMILTSVCSPQVHAQDERDVAVSPKAPWGNFDLVVEEEPHWSRTALLWLPNRILDFVDIFRVDVGVGNSWGASVKATEYVQLGYREMNPRSYRIGAFGRMEPFISESGYEGGISTFYRNTDGRPPCASEFGAGLDILFIGAHLGLCSAELVDFVAGIATFDTAEDDLM